MGASAITITRERFGSFYAEALPLIHRHYHDIALWHDIPLKVNVDAFEAAEAAGAQHNYVARLDGVIVGYAMFLVKPAVHYADSLQAICTAIYVDPEARAAGVGMKLLRGSERALRESGVQVIWHRSKVAHPELGKVLGFMGYQNPELTWVKRLDGGG